MRSEQRLYLMENSAQLNKIGIAKNPQTRKRQLELASGQKIKIIKCWETIGVKALEVEQSLHVQYARRRQQGEWFTHITVGEIEMLSGYDLIECHHDGTLRRIQ